MNADGSGMSFWEIAKGGWILAAAVLAWVGRGHISHDSRVHENVYNRLGDLEADRVYKGDLSNLNDKLDEILMLLARGDHRR